MLNKIFELYRSNVVGLYRITGKKEAKVTGVVSTEKRKATEEDFKNHLSGRCGLGLSPLLDDNTCTWGAIDVDVYPFDIVSFSKKYSSVPVYPCRTKSGGLHLYFFFTPKPADKVRVFLEEMAYLLGFLKFEVFPKQENLEEERQANWINLPYFNATERTCVLDGKDLTLEEFHDSIKKIKSFKKVLGKFQFSGAPKCILKLQAEDIVEGYRDVALLNIGVFLKNKFQDWDKRLIDVNNLLTNPLTVSELQSNIINQLERKGIFYQCASILKDYCEDPYGCREKSPVLNKIKFGENIIKLDTRPAVWKLEINGKWIKMYSADLLDMNKFRLHVLENLNILIPRIKSENWEKLIQEKLEHVIIETAPIDATVDSDFYQYLKDFCIRFSNSRNDTDVLNGRVIVEKDQNLFKSESLKNYLRKKGLSHYKGNRCYELICEIKGGAKNKRINDKVHRLWFVPVYPEQIEEQRNNNIPDFSKSDKEEF